MYGQSNYDRLFEIVAYAADQIASDFSTLFESQNIFCSADLKKLWLQGAENESRSISITCSKSFSVADLMLLPFGSLFTFIILRLGRGSQLTTGAISPCH